MKKDDYMAKNFLLVSLEEKKAKKIAEVLNNSTSRKIIDHLAKKDSTESEISKDMDIPISTVHYNLKLLQEAGLVTVEEFHYSQRGKEVNHYSLANKYIIIAPKSEDLSFLDALKKIMPIAVIAAAVAFVMRLFYLLSSQPLQDMSLRTVASESGSMMMAKAASAPAVVSEPTAYFVVGIIAVIVIYFVYVWVKKD